MGTAQAGPQLTPVCQWFPDRNSRQRLTKRSPRRAGHFVPLPYLNAKANHIREGFFGRERPKLCALWSPSSPPRRWTSAGHTSQLTIHPVPLFIPRSGMGEGQEEEGTQGTEGGGDRRDGRERGGREPSFKVAGKTWLGFNVKPISREKMQQVEPQSWGVRETLHPLPNILPALTFYVHLTWPGPPPPASFHKQAQSCFPPSRPQRGCLPSTSDL